MSREYWQHPSKHCDPMMPQPAMPQSNLDWRDHGENKAFRLFNRVSISRARSATGNSQVIGFRMCGGKWTQPLPKLRCLVHIHLSVNAYLI